MADDWDLQAVVRGCAAGATSSSSTATAVSSTSCSPDVYSDRSFFQPQADRFQFFPDPLKPYGSRENVEELHDLFKPFYPRLQSLSPQSSPISSISFLRGLQDLSPSPPPPPAPPQQEEKQRQKQPVAGTARIIAAGSSIASSANTPRSKRRKNQLKRVCQVPAEGLSSDMWSWRKYGQKPIKGSPYPRGYYRCSTSKGCLARKQVERDRSDPGMFTVTYTGEHNHPMPTHRNSLAGSTRQKTVTPQTATTATEGDTNSKPSCSPPVSPTTSLSPVTEKVVRREERELDLVEDEDVELGVSDTVISDDFFEGLEELNGPPTGDCFPTASLLFPWMANSATTTTAAGGG